MNHLYPLITQACRLEATAIKAGNVHPAASFADCTYDDFVRSGQIIAQEWQDTRGDFLGDRILAAATAVNNQIGRNTNLGIILLLAPLLSAAERLISNRATGEEVGVDELQQALSQVLSTTDVDDARAVMAAIRLAAPGGLGQADDSQLDVNNAEAPPVTLLAAMAAAAHRDAIAAAYVCDFADVFALARQLTDRIDDGQELLPAISELQIDMLARQPDTLIARKCGEAIAEDVSRRAAAVLAARSHDPSAYHAAWQAFDAYLRSDGNRLNPGTTADLLAAAIFVHLLTHPEHAIL